MLKTVNVRHGGSKKTVTSNKLTALLYPQMFLTFLDKRLE
jgi:hypothetical protein